MELRGLKETNFSRRREDLKSEGSSKGDEAERNGGTTAQVSSFLLCSVQQFIWIKILRLLQTVEPTEQKPTKRIPKVPGTQVCTASHVAPPPSVLEEAGAHTFEGEDARLRGGPAGRVTMSPSGSTDGVE